MNSPQNKNDIVIDSKNSWKAMLILLSILLVLGFFALLFICRIVGEYCLNFLPFFGFLFIAAPIILGGVLLVFLVSWLKNHFKRS